MVVPPMAPGAPGGEQLEHRRVYITRADLDRHGCTQDCPGCTAAQTNQRPRTHSEGCRARLEEAMTQDELGRDRLLRAALRRAEPAEAVPEDQDEAMEPARPDPAPARPSAAGLIRRGDKRVLGPVGSDQSKAGKARLNPSQGEKRPGGELGMIAGLTALPAPPSQSSSSGQNDPMQVTPTPDHPAAPLHEVLQPGRIGASPGVSQWEPYVLLRELQAAEAATEGSVCAIEIELAMEAADRLCADAVALAEAYSPERFKPRAGACGLRAGLAS